MYVCSHQSDQTLMYEFQIIKFVSRILFNLIFILCLFVVDESKTHLFLSPLFKYISSLKSQFNVKL